MATEHLYHSASSATKSYRLWKLKKSLDGSPSRYQSQPVFDKSCEGSLFPTFPKRSLGSLLKLRSTSESETRRPPIGPKVTAGKSARSMPSSPRMPPVERPKTTDLRSRKQEVSGNSRPRTPKTMPDFGVLPPGINVKRYSMTNAADARQAGQVCEKVIFATTSFQHTQLPRTPLYSHTEGEAQETTEQNFRAARHRSMQRKEELTWSVVKGEILTFSRAWLKDYIYKDMGQKAVVDRLNQIKLCPFTSTEVMFMKSQVYAKAQGGETDVAFINGETRKLMQKAADIKVEKEAWRILQEDFDVYSRVCQERQKQLEHMRKFPLEKLPNGKFSSNVVLGNAEESVDKPVQNKGHDLFALLQNAEMCMNLEFRPLFEELVRVTGAFKFEGGARYMRKYGPSLKKLQRIAEKMFRCYRMDFRCVTDIVRCSLVYHNIEALCKALEYMLGNLKSHGFTILRVKNRLHPDFDVRESGGYRDVSMNVIGALGHVCEIQLHWLPIFQIKIGGDSDSSKESGHKRYIRFRDVRLQ